jgi:cell division septal protein FtsQ
MAFTTVQNEKRKSEKILREVRILTPNMTEIAIIILVILIVLIIVIILIIIMTITITILTIIIPYRTFDDQTGNIFIIVNLCY